MSKFLLIHLTCALLVIFLACGSGLAQSKKKEKTTILEVPTTGKIMDVEYRPEFDEWWVKCREGEQISVYLYELKNHTWRKALFIPKKTEAPDKKQEKTKLPIMPEKDKEPVETPIKVESPKAPTEKEIAKPVPSTKWWDPLNILKEGEKLIKPWSAEGSK